MVIRRHRLTQVSLDDLVERGSLSPIAASFLRAAVKARLSIVVYGAQGSGKTTMARALCGEFGRKEAIATIIGEVRGDEVWQMIKAMESGSGSICTTHSANARAAMRKLITCAMEYGPQITHELATLKLAETIDLIVQLDMESVEHPDGSETRTRWVSEIVAITTGEKEKGYAATTVFDDRGTRVALAHTLPDEMRRLERHGFDLDGFLTEARANGDRSWTR